MVGSLVTATDAFDVIAGEVHDPLDVSSDRPNGSHVLPDASLTTVLLPRIRGVAYVVAPR